MMNLTNFTKESTLVLTIFIFLLSTTSSLTFCKQELVLSGNNYTNDAQQELVLSTNDNTSNTQQEDGLECYYGDCDRNGKCVCKQYYSGTNCNFLFQDELGTPYVVYFYFNCVLWILVTAYVAYKGYLFYTHDPYLSDDGGTGRKRKIRASIGIRHLTIFLLFIGCLLRIPSYFITIDLDWQRNVDMQPFGALTFYFFYPCLISSYTCQLFIWIEMVTANTLYIPIHKLPRLRKLFIAVNVIIFPVELITRILLWVFKSSSLSANLVYLVWLLYFGAVVLVGAFGSLTTGIKILRTIREISLVNRSESIRKKVRLMTLWVVIITCMLLVGVVLIVLSAFISQSDASAYYPVAWSNRIVEAAITCIMVWSIRPSSKPGSGHTTASGNNSKQEMSEKSATDIPSHNSSTV